MSHKIKLEVSEKNEATESPYWLILDPRQMMKPDVHSLASMITGPFFSREAAEGHLKRRSYAFTERAVAFCHSGYWARQYKESLRTAKKEPESAEFIHGILYAVQELINLGQETAAVEVMKNSGIPKEDFEYCQEECDYLNDAVYKNLKLAF